MTRCDKTTHILSFNQALDNILSLTTAITESETILLSQAGGRILAQPIISPANVPSFDNSAMDGYAVRLTDFTQPNITLPVIGKSFAGHPFNDQWPQGTCVRIMTGAPLPEGADAVIMQEQAEETPQGITFKIQPKNKQNIRFIGEEIVQGAIILDAGTKLGVTTLPIIASLGISQIEVYRQPKVALFTTGDELQSIGQPLKEGQIYDTNSMTIKMMLEKLGCHVIDLGIIADQPKLIEDAFMAADKIADIVITSGGVSVGEADYTKEILEKLGQINFWKIAMKPGKPFAFGRLNNALFCGLPGNPVSAAVTFYLLVQPLLMKFSGCCHWLPAPQFKVKTVSALKKTPGRIDFQRGLLFTDATGNLQVKTTGNQGSHIFSSFHQGNCFIILESERGPIAAGELVTVAPFNSLLQD